MRILIFLAALGLAVGVQAQAPAGQDTPAAATEQGPPTLADMTVPVMINGQGPFRFAIDSGSTTTLIAAELAERLQLPEKGRVRVHAMSGVSSLRTVHIDEIHLSDSIRTDIRVAAVPRENLGVDGLLGINLLKKQRVTLDFVERAIRIQPSDSVEDEPLSHDISEIVVTARLRRGQLVMADAEADGKKVWVIVDSGSQSSVGNSRLMQLLVKRSSEHEILPISLMDVLGRSTAAEYTHVERLRLGGMLLSPIPIAFADAHPFKLFDLMRQPSLLLGMETLQNFNRVSIDFATRKVSFEVARKKLGPPVRY